MTPDDFNALVAKLIAALEAAPYIGAVGAGMAADEAGALPEIYVNVDEADLCLTVAPL